MKVTQSVCAYGLTSWTFMVIPSLYAVNHIPANWENLWKNLSYFYDIKKILC